MYIKMYTIIYNMDINNFIYPSQFIQALNPVPAHYQNVVEEGNLEEKEDVITLQYIIVEKPPTSIVRKFMRFNLESIVSEEQEMFSNR